jgi:hypothetical protein
VQTAVEIRDAFDHRHRPAHRCRKSKARQDSRISGQHRTGTALTVIAALFGAGQPEVLSERIKEGCARIDPQVPGSTIDHEVDGDGDASSGGGSRRLRPPVLSDGPGERHQRGGRYGGGKQRPSAHPQSMPGHGAMKRVSHMPSPF